MLLLLLLQGRGREVSPGVRGNCLVERAVLVFGNHFEARVTAGSYGTVDTVLVRLLTQGPAQQPS